VISLDGAWEFFPGAESLDELASLEPASIRVPGLWEAQGYADLDGVAWYRRRFELNDVAGWWSLRFGAVMDIADVFVNGTAIGTHDGAFTPFELDPTGVLVAGENEIAVRVDDPPLGHPDHGRMPHGKQGWNNETFPSRPSLYMTYGGIWQPVTLHRHGPVVARDVFANGDPEGLAVTIDVCNRTGAATRASVRMETLGRAHELEVDLGPGERRTLLAPFGEADAPRWSPEAPVLHELGVGVSVGGESSDRQTVRYGLRTVRVDGTRLLLNGEPYRMKSVLVQGFHAEELYAEGDSGSIREEIVAAKAVGFNTLRLHIKAFDPRYLDLCDEVGMLVHCDLPVAEPVDYDEVGPETLLARRCVDTAREQVRRDRNHPSIVLWTAMNELGERRIDRSPGGRYAAFARMLVGTIDENDGTRPVIENDWFEFSGRTVYASPILTAHWYGRLHRDYLDKLDRKIARSYGEDRVLLVSEFGDWGLPAMPERPDPPFWDAREAYASAVAEMLWPGSVESFVEETQRYQGVSDRLQAELFRRHDRLAGYCLTELTDVPHELNGLLDLHRRPKRAAVEEMTRANQPVLPMLDLRSFVVVAGTATDAPLHLANDGAALNDVVVDVDGAAVHVGDVAAHSAGRAGRAALSAPAAPGPFDVVLRLSASGAIVAENRYRLRAVDEPRLARDLCVLGAGATAAALEELGARLDREAPALVAEGALDGATANDVAARLAAGETVVVLAQPWEAYRWYPVDVRIRPLDTRWGSSAFTFTTGRMRLAAFPEGGLLVGEDGTFHARGVVVSIDGRSFPDEPIVVRYNPMGTLGTIVGAHPVGRGRLVFCQYRLVQPALGGDVAARSLLADLAALATR
jgi:hypothetical protein